MPKIILNTVIKLGKKKEKKKTNPKLRNPSIDQIINVRVLAQRYIAFYAKVRLQIANLLNRYCTFKKWYNELKK